VKSEVSDSGAAFSNFPRRVIINTQFPYGRRFFSSGNLSRLCVDKNVAGVSANLITQDFTRGIIKCHANGSAGTALSAQGITLTADEGVTLSDTALTSDANGQATASLTSATAGTYQVTATLADGTSSVNQRPVPGCSSV